MKVYKLDFEVNKYENFIPEIPFDWETIQSFDGRKQADCWKRIKVHCMDPDKGLPLGDAPGFSLLPVFSRKALDCLLPLIQNHVEILPLDFEKEFFAINVITVLDCIDYDRSIYNMFSDGKRIMAFKKYAFTSEINGSPIFKTIDENRRRGFVSEEFKRIVEANKLKGFDLKLVWQG